MVSLAALAALFAATACGSDDGPAGSTTTSPPTSLAVPSTTVVAATSAPATTVPTATTSPRPTPSAATVTTTRATGSTNGEATCVSYADGSKSCTIPGRPLRRRRRRRGSAAGDGLLLPLVDGDGGPGDEARAEYASVASFGELALRLLALGAPAALVAECHRAALDEIRHASLCGALAGRPAASFGSIPGLLGRRLGGRRRSRRVQLQRLAVESFLDGWVNEGAAAAVLRRRAERAASPQDRLALRSMAEDEQRHADLARAVVTWCFDQEPAAVGRALGHVAAA